MEHANQSELSRWVEERTQLLEPPTEWQPDSRTALAALHQRMDARRSHWMPAWIPWAVAASLVCATLLMLPSTRALAQQLWQFLTVRRVEVVRVNFNDLPHEASSLFGKLLNKPEPSVTVRDAEEARQRAGFAPRLPRPGILSGSPQLSTMGAISMGTSVKVADVELALSKAGVTDLAVPKEWDGAQVAIHTSMFVVADWPDVKLIQCLPLTITTPPGFNLPAFSVAVLRAVGMHRSEAERLAQRMTAAPAFLMPLGIENEVNMREVNLRTGPGTMIEILGKDAKVEGVVIFWGVTDRLYVLSSKLGANLAIATANAIE